ncbi:hypothetical protein DMC01_00430 [Campylobacter troglodytis]|nr:hypothetical protein DMC01_00430 [Campylobacter troglodytis]
MLNSNSPKSKIHAKLNLNSQKSKNSHKFTQKALEFELITLLATILQHRYLKFVLATFMLTNYNALILHYKCVKIAKIAPCKYRQLLLAKRLG